MSDNEKRAHDLAMQFWQITSNYYANELRKDIDAYIAYKLTYDKMLENLNRDYPQGIS